MRNIKFAKGMTKEEINKLIKDHVLLEDEIYINAYSKHNWKCLCGNVIEGKRWADIRSRKSVKCVKCKYEESELRYRYEVEKDGEYEYIRSFRKGDTLPNGKIVNKNPFLKIKHLYCGKEYIVGVGNFINDKQRCNKCCGSYENSFAYHIEVELGEPLEKYWDFEKNTVNPCTITKSNNQKVYIKCQEKEYHGSYEIRCAKFTNGARCNYCHLSGKNFRVHPLDSFGQYLKDNNLLHLWSDKNKIDPFKISKSNDRKVWIICDKHDYHNDYGGYEVQCNSFVNGSRCSYCNSKGKLIHPLDSFGYQHFDKVLSWHPDNNISPFRVANYSNKKYKFICETCNHEWSANLSNITNLNQWCPKCASSKGERRISEWLKKNNIKYENEKAFDRLISDLGNSLRYDFYLPDYNTLIEYDGLQHDKWIKSWISKEDFDKLQYHDRLKNEYAKNNNIKLIRIKEKDFDNIEDILDKELLKEVD
ncbi:hypothetical protein UT300012_31740 [Paraclostridium bifermentans]